MHKFANHKEISSLKDSKGDLTDSNHSGDLVTSMTNTESRRRSSGIIEARYEMNQNEMRHENSFLVIHDIKPIMKEMNKDNKSLNIYGQTNIAQGFQLNWMKMRNGETGELLWDSSSSWGEKLWTDQLIGECACTSTQRISDVH